MDENTKVEELTNERDTLRLEVTRAEILNELVKGAKVIFLYNKLY